MRQATLSTLILATTLIAASCGLSDKERTTILQAQKAKNDSVRIAEIRAVKDEETYKASLRDSLSSYTSLLTRQQRSLAEFKARLNSGEAQLTPNKTVELTSLEFAVQHSQDQISQLRRQLSHPN